jgi:hypothetical protein
MCIGVQSILQDRTPKLRPLSIYLTNVCLLYGMVMLSSCQLKCGAGEGRAITDHDTCESVAVQLSWGYKCYSWCTYELYIFGAWFCTKHNL